MRIQPLASLCLFSHTILQPSAFQRRKSPSVVPRGWQTCQRICGPATEPDTQPLSPVHPRLTRSMRKVHSSDQKGCRKLSGATLPAGCLTTQKCMQGVLHKSSSTHRHPSCPEIPKSGSHDNTAPNVIYKCVCARVLLCV